MLVLTREVSERVLISGDIIVTVVRIDGGKVRLGFEAPPDVAIVREEISGKTPTERQTRGERGTAPLRSPREGRGPGGSSSSGERPPSGGYSSQGGYPPRPGWSQRKR